MPDVALKPLMLDPAECQKAARYAVRVHEEMSKRSQLLRQEAAEVVAQFDRDEIFPYLGELLGKGGFNNVYELERVKLSRDPSSCDTKNNNHNNPAAQEQREMVAYSKCKLAVKFLSDEAMASPEEFCNGAADLLMEAKYLTALAAHPHPALIQLHGVCTTGPAGFESTVRGGFFLVIDRLYDTLDRRIDVWIEVRRRNCPKQGESSHSNDRKILAGLLVQRLLVAQDIASALRHLHKLQIVFRDLKPDNIGFCYEGRVKLFDFGLAKELDPMQKSESGLYKMSGGTGSRRFMAPEVALSEPYNLSADMYSFGILLWELLTLDKAFARMPVDEHRERVVKNNERPEIDPGWSEQLQEMLEGCWNPSPFARPSAKDVYKALWQEVQNKVAEDFPKQAAEDELRRNMGYNSK
jgi:serine/threonine protein kinase